MPRRYSAFLVRCWALGDGSQRTEIACISSGEKVLVGTLTAATAWMAARVDGAAGGAPEAAEDSAAPEPRPDERSTSDARWRFAAASSRP